MRYLQFLMAALMVTMGCAVWFNRTLRNQWQTGFVAGEAAARQLYQQKLDRMHAVTEEVRAASDRRGIQLEKNRSDMQKQLAAVAAAVGKDSRANINCLGPDVMRALAKTGIEQPGDSPGSGKPD